MASKIETTLSRRGFLQGTAGLTFVISAGGLLAACDAREQATSQEPVAPNIWVSVAGDGTVTIQFPATEMGQGSMTTLPAVLAEEMDADWSKVAIETVAVHDTRYGNPIFGSILYTAGSATLEGYFETLRKAGAQARKVLMNAAAAEWGVPEGELSTKPGAVVHGPSGRRLGYGAIAQFAELPETLPEISESDLKARSDYRLLGSDVPRVDIPEKVDGSARYGMDVQLPGMVYAAILHAPVEGERPVEVGETDARAIPGVTDVVTLESAVAVVGERIESVLKARGALAVTWSRDSDYRAADSETTLTDYMARAKDFSERGVPWREDGDARSAIDGAAQVLEADYMSDYAYHAQMEPMAATAHVTEDGKAAEIWVGTQTQTNTILGAAQALGTSPDKITLHPLYLGGGFGRRSLFRQRYIDDALFVSKAVGRPVKVIWSREEDVAQGVFRPAAAQILRAGLDAEGNVVGWQHRVAAPSVIEYMNPGRWERAGGQDIITMLGSESANYAVPNFLAEHVMTERGARVCAWRAVATSYTKFAAESFVDELAEAAGRDPLELRLGLCAEAPRARAVLRRVAEMTAWDRPREDTALGLALASYKKSVSAGVAEIGLDRESGRIGVRRFWLAADPGFAVAPDNVRAQLEGNIIFGLSNALREQITVKEGRVQQSNFHDYTLLRMSEVPEVEIEVLATDHPPSGVGELGLATVTGAVANAFARLTGKRLRRLPFTPEHVRAALAA